MLFGHLIASLAFLLQVVALILVFTSYLSPFPERHRALISIVPNMTAEQYLASGSNTVYSPRVMIGLFGSCVQPNSRAFYNCTSIKGGNYSVDILPDSAPKSILRRPHDALRIFIGVSICLLFVNIFTWGLFQYLPLQKNGTSLWWWGLDVIIEYIPALSVFFGLVGFVTVHTLFNKTCHDFNEYQINNPNEVTERGTFVASTGNGFLLAWFAYGFLFHTMSIFWVVFYKEEKATPAPPAAAPDALPTKA